MSTSSLALVNPRALAFLSLLPYLAFLPPTRIRWTALATIRGIRQWRLN